MVLQDERTIFEIFSLFQKANPEPKTELLAPNAFTLLVSVVLSAQATDRSVNKATEALYKKVQTPEAMLALGEEGLKEHIKTIGLYRVKAGYVIRLSKILVDEFQSKIPLNREDLERLPGVGRKTASVILNVLAGEATMPVDTHLLRISPRIGLSDGKTPLQVEKDLLERIPKEFLQHAHHWLILHGRYVCIARNPKCKSCLISHLCKKNCL
ncbi:MAG TPA: endonuclease III [Treponemataceae bacterium]|nr:endonuclease III [Treponemataceae bacterium]